MSTIHWQHCVRAVKIIKCYFQLELYFRNNHSFFVHKKESEKKYGLRTRIGGPWRGQPHIGRLLT